jgi:hypothetical protein
MPDITSIVTSGIAKLAQTADGIIDKYIETPDEKRAAKQWLQEQAFKVTEQQSKEIIATVNARSAVVVAELNQGDNYTKRARPTVVYAGLFFIFYCYCLAPLPFLVGEQVSLPAEFWFTWGGVCSVWSIGRTAERIKPKGTVDKLLNTTEPYTNAIAKVFANGR